MPDLPRSFSPSSAGTYRQCPRRWRFRYVQTLPYPPAEPSLLRTFAHRVLALLCVDPSPARTIAPAPSLALPVPPATAPRRPLAHAVRLCPLPGKNACAAHAPSSLRRVGIGVVARQDRNKPRAAVPARHYPFQSDPLESSKPRKRSALFLPLVAGRARPDQPRLPRLPRAPARLRAYRQSCSARPAPDPAPGRWPPEPCAGCRSASAISAPPATSTLRSSL